MSATLDCPESARWQALLAATLPPDQRERCERHLESCAACQDRLDQAEEGRDPLLQLARQVGDPTAAPADPTLTQVLERLHGVKCSAEPADLYFLRPCDRPGTLGILGDYEVREVIGEGGMGVVLKAFDPALHRLVAIKVVAAALAGSATARRRFTREAQAAAAVSHDHIVTVHGVHEADGLPYLVMQYVAGESLQARLDRTGPLEVAELVRIGFQTASALAAAHAQGLIHRDIKPANLLLENGLARVKITDFGLARMADDVRLTQNGVVAGTPEYMAPEQARGDAIDHRADLFSLGSVLYAMCTGVPPFRGSTALSVLRQVSDQTPMPIRSLNPEMPAWLETLVARLLAKAPGDRFQSAAEVAALLEGYLAHLRQPTTVPAPELPVPPTERSSQRVQPFPSRHWLMALLVLTILGVGLLALQIAGATGEPGKMPFEFYHDFRGRPAPPELRPFGDPEGQYVRVEPEGLRITLPKDRAPPLSVGFTTSFGVQGDFEVTATYEVLQADEPPSGYGVGVGMFVKKADPSPEGATLSRLVRPGGKDIVLWDRSIERPGGKPRIEEGRTPCTSSVVRLRMKRTGATLRYLWAPGTTGEDFQEIHQCEFGAEDIKHITLSALTGRQPCHLDARLLDWRLRSGDPAAAQPVAEAPKSRWKLWLAATVFGLVVALSVGVWLFARPGRRAEEPAPAPVEGKPAQTKVASQPAPVKRPPNAGGRHPGRLGLLALALVATGGLGVAAALVATAGGTEPKTAATPEAAQEYYHAFKGNPGNRQGFELVGPNADSCVLFEPEGLRITLPDGWGGQRPTTGVSLPLTVKGDFEITMGFEVLKEPESADTVTGTRLSLGIYQIGDRGNLATHSRAVGAKLGSIIVTWMAELDEETGKQKPRSHTYPTKARTGQLRLVRTGPVLSYHVAEEPGGEFALLQQYPFGEADLKEVRLIGSTGGPKAALDARVTDLRIRAKALSDVSTASESSAAVPAKSRWKLWLAAAVIALVVALSVGVWLYVRPGRRIEQTPAPTPTPEPAPEKSEPAEPEAPVEPLTFPCSGCGKKLKVRAEQTGRQVKCPRCGQAQAVPEVKAEAPDRPPE